MESAMAIKPFGFSDYSVPKRVVLSSDQRRYCLEALEVFKNKRLSAPEKIREEFMTLEANKTTNEEIAIRSSVALNSTNITKNRYPDVFAYDDNPLFLDSSAYINASILKISENASKFIATQGPLPNTFEDFWEMIIQHRCPVIVMLTKLVENGKKKCGDYFQSEDGNSTRRFGDICIVTKWINTSQRSLIMRCLEVNRVDSKEEPLCVLHIQYPDWPDHGVPGDTLVVSEILKHTYSNVGPIVVHCSAGIGRTGTYCAIHNTIQRILVGDMSARDLDKTIAGFRTQRMRMVSTMEQYLFCYDAIIDELEQFISDTNEV